MSDYIFHPTARPDNPAIDDCITWLFETPAPLQLMGTRQLWEVPGDFDMWLLSCDLSTLQERRNIIEVALGVQFDGEDKHWGAMRHHLSERLNKIDWAISRRDNRPGYVYLVQVLVLVDDLPKRVYKIGRTNNPQDRVHTFSVRLPYPIEYTACQWFPDMYFAEVHFHHLLANRRIRGEWFDLTEYDVYQFKGLFKELPA